MTAAKAIKNLRTIKRSCMWSLRAEDALDTAIEALEKQKAKCWIKEDRGHVEYSAVCPDCGYDTFWSDTEDFDYCPSCGQMLKRGEGGSDGSV